MQYVTLSQGCLPCAAGLHAPDMVAIALLLGALPLVAAAPAAESASTFAGATSTAVYPPPGATVTTYETYFPDAEEVGFAGPTPSALQNCLVASSVLV